MRNNCEYPDLNTPAITSDDVREACIAADAIVDLAQRFIVEQRAFSSQTQS